MAPNDPYYEYYLRQRDMAAAQQQWTSSLANMAAFSYPSKVEVRAEVPRVETINRKLLLLEGVD